jgi:DNA topoisomerase-1
VRDDRTIERIRKLAIPPAWTDVWICATGRGHLQATGRDDRGRKQYRYHEKWRATRDEAKYDRMIPFGEALPVVRERVESDLALTGLPREKVLAVTVRLLEDTLIRVGNEEYARQNRSFGLTTLRDRHVEVNGSEISFEFVGKSGKKHQVDVRDRRLARVVKQLRDLPGQELFQFVDDDGNRQSVGSHDVNNYLRETTGEEFTAKDIRTWAGTVRAALSLLEIGPFDAEGDGLRNVVTAIESVASQLGNTPAICRKCYVHPAVIDAYLEGSLCRALRPERGKRPPRHVSPEENAVLRFLRRRQSLAVNGR